MPPVDRKAAALTSVLVAVAVGWVLHQGASILQPLVIALLLAGMLRPVVLGLMRWRIPPGVTVVALTFALFFGLAQVGLLVQKNLESFLQVEIEDLEPSLEPERSSERQRPPSPPGDTRGDTRGDEASAEQSAPSTEDRSGGEERPPSASEADASGAAQPEAPGEGGAAAPAGTGEEGDAAGAPREGLEEERGSGSAGDESGSSGAGGDPGTGGEGSLGTQDPDEERLDPFFERGDAAIAESGGWPAVKAGLDKRLVDSELSPTLKTMARGWLQDMDLGSITGSIIGSGIGFVRGLGLVMLYLLFIFAEAAVFKRKILLVAGRRRQDASEVLDSIGRGIQRYLGVHTLISLATGCLCYIGLVVLEVPFALLFALIAFVLNYIPTFGSIIATFFPLVTALGDPDPGFWQPVLVVVLYLSVNLTLGSFLEPKILGRELNLSPLVILVSVVVWGGIWGIIGALLAVPLTSTLQIVLANLETTKPVAILLSSGPPREPG